MLEKLSLKNFQCHRNLTVEFDPHITVLVGPSDVGKSAVVRALRWTVLNKLSGRVEDYIRWGKDFVRVTLLADGRAVTRARGKSSNTYHLDGGVYRAFHNGVPEDISELLACDQDTFQRQPDSQFWLSDSAGRVAKNLNQIVNLEVMDEAQARCQKRLRTAKVKEEVCRERLQKAREEKKQLLWVMEASRLLTNLEKIDERLDVKRSTIAQAGRTLESVIGARRDLVRASAGLPEGLNAIRAGERYRRANERAERARELIRDYREAWRGCQGKVPDLSPMLTLRKKLDSFAERRRGCEELVREYRNRRSHCAG